MGVDRSPPAKQSSGGSRDDGDSNETDKADKVFGRLYRTTRSGSSGGGDNADGGDTGEVDSGNQSDCGRCLKSVRKQDNGVQCDNCENWYHAACVNIDNAHYRILSKLPSMEWVCKICKDKIATLIEENSQLKCENKSLKEENRVLRERLAALEKRVDEIKNEVKEEIKKEMKDEIMKEVNNNVVKVLEDIQEAENKRNREGNLVLYNMVESERENGRDRAHEDANKCHQLIQEGIGLEQNDYSIRKAIRLGKPQNNTNRPRPLLIKLESVEEKWLILKKARNLKNYRHPILKKVIVTPDLTPKEQEKDRMLRQQLKEKIDEGEQGWYIKGGKLNRQNFQREEQGSAR